ncbi:protocatechuate 3,4-dioxygenase subunit beta [Breoghania sp.]|uniref:protocatechuate 3,4-dioxygenase subunit beta n=1 Tax=Breoghania sp. TaxID=2065378 RepID=UPI0029CA1494|nr:protocatechuate 3,4-dioxygenase subunit beta [Breoghania sp.]
MSSAYNPRDWMSHPAYLHAPYKSTVLRSPTKPLIPMKQSLSVRTGPVYGHEKVGVLDADLTKNGARNGEPLGERIIVTGRVLDEDGRPVRNTLVEVWQANAAGRYIHKVDQHDAPLDPNFFGGGRCVTDDEGRYTFKTIKPGAYPWGNHLNAWRPNHIHFSLLGPSISTRLVTQMYFPGDPLLNFDPIYQGTPENARERLISRFSLDVTQPEFALGYEFDIVLRGRNETPMED